jgi:hypothetical protein
LKPTGGGKFKYVTIVFEEGKRHITVTVGDGAARLFPIAADENHRFIKSPAGEEITADEFSRLALEDALFKPAAEKRPHIQANAKHTAWS